MGIFEAIEKEALDKETNLAEVKNEVGKLIATDPNQLKNMANQSGYSPLMCAINKKKYEIAIYLLTVKEIDVNKYSSRGVTALLMALASSGTKEVVDALLEHEDIDVNKPTSRGVTPLIMAIDKSPQNAYALLEHKNIDVNQPSKLPKHKNIDVNRPSNEEVPPIVAVVIYNRKMLALRLLKEGANIDAITTPEGRTALHEAAYQGSVRLVQTIYKYKPDIHAKDKYGKTPLHLAAEKGHTEIVNLLLEMGANKEAVDENQKTPLHLAAEKGHTEIVNLLLERGANIEAVDQNQKKPLQLAEENNHTDVVDALEEEKAARAAEAAETESAANILRQLAKRPYTTIVSQKENPEKKGRGR